MSSAFRSTLCALGLALLAAACAVNPVTGERELVLMSEAEELALGQRFDAEIRRHYGVYPDAALAAYVDRVGTALAERSHRPELIFRFAVVDDPMINAFALPGGYVYVTRGILAHLNDEAQLAAVLGHEIGHVTHRHAVQRYTAGTLAGLAAQVIGYRSGAPAYADLAELLGGALLAGYGRAQELEADERGAEYLARAGYDPAAMIEVIGLLKAQAEWQQRRAREAGEAPPVYHGVFATHPDHDRRLRELVDAARRYRTGQTRPSNRETYLRAIEGLSYGPPADQGVVRGDTFYHGPLGFALPLPPGWALDDTPAQLRLRSPDRTAEMRLRVLTLAKRFDARSVLWMERPRGLRLLREEALTIDGLPAHSALLSDPRETLRARLTVIVDGGRAFWFFGTVPREALARHDATLEAVPRGWRRLRPEERPLAEPLRIVLHRVRPGEDYAALAAASPLRDDAEDRLRLLNGDWPDGRLQPGRLIKLLR